MLCDKLMSMVFPSSTLFRSRRHGHGHVLRARLERAHAADRARGGSSAAERRQARDARTLLHRLQLRASRACLDRKSTRLNSSHVAISYAVFCLKKKILSLT